MFGKNPSKKYSMIFKVAIVGCGNIGFRHIEALCRVKSEIFFYIIDQDVEAIKKSKLNLEQNMKTYKIVSSLEDIEEDLDLLILSTSSKPRYKLLEQSKILNIKNIILEKFLFNDLRQYASIEKNIESYKNCYVNCTRRAMPSYVELQKILHDITEFRVVGSNIGLACNAIHYIDLLSYFLEEENLDLEFSTMQLTDCLSKRTGYTEYTGRVCGNLSNIPFVIESYKEEGIERKIIFQSKNYVTTIKEDSGTIQVYDKAKSALKIKEFSFPYLSSVLIDEYETLLLSGRTHLTPLRESICLHRCFLDSLINNTHWIKDQNVRDIT